MFVLIGRHRQRRSARRSRACGRAAPRSPSKRCSSGSSYTRTFGRSWHAARETVNARYGIYEVEAFTANGQLRPATPMDGRRWRRLIVSESGGITPADHGRCDDPVPRRATTRQKHTYSLTTIFNPYDTITLTYSEPGPRQFMLTGKLLRARTSACRCGRRRCRHSCSRPRLPLGQRVSAQPLVEESAKRFCVRSPVHESGVLRKVRLDSESGQVPPVPLSESSRH